MLVEKRDLTHGTTGRYHGLLHSGGRYVVKDPRSAEECIQENRILRKTHTHCIEDTGSFFVVTPEDEGDYPDKFKAASAQLHLPCEELTLKEAFRREPMLNQRIGRVFAVPDGATDSFLATHATAQAAQLAGATVLIYHEVVKLLVEGGEGDRRVVGAVVKNVVNDEEMVIRATMTLNASRRLGRQGGSPGGDHRQRDPGQRRHGRHEPPPRQYGGKWLQDAPANSGRIVPVHTVAIIGTTDEGRRPRVAAHRAMGSAADAGRRRKIGAGLQQGACAAGVGRGAAALPGRLYRQLATPPAPSPCWTTRPGMA